ncbi:stage II sporulation protein P [Bacillus pacificus]
MKKTCNWGNPALHETIGKKYPGVSRGVIQKGFQTGNGGSQSRFVGTSAILTEVGGVDNTEEGTKSTELMRNTAKAFGEYFWQAKRK